MKTCLECYNLFDRDTDLIAGSPCPILKCCGQVIEIDDNILHTITQLNKKGYPTAHCCAGHTWGNNPFIVFDNIVYPDAFPYLPKEFKSEIIHNEMLRIHKLIPECSVVNAQRYLMDASVDLMVWSESLPPAVELVADFGVIDNTYLSAFDSALHKRLNIAAGYFSGENGQAKEALLTTYLSPNNAKVLEEKIKCFANEEGISVSVDIFD